MSEPCEHDWIERKATFTASTPRTRMRWRDCTRCHMREDLPLAPEQQAAQDEELEQMNRYYGL